MAKLGRAQGRAGAWPGSNGTTRGLRWAWPDSLRNSTGSAAGQITQWAAAEVEPGRLMPWLPVAFGLGVALYFTAEREPAWWAVAALALTSTIGAYIARRRPVAFPVTVGLAAISAGFAVPTLRTAVVEHPVLWRAAYNVELSGFVERREERERSDRIVVRVHRLDGMRRNERVERVRLSVRKGTAPAVGTYLSTKARLNPPLQPLRPGSYDFSRDLYFQRIGAIGFVTGTIKIEAAPIGLGIRLRMASVIESIRDTIDRRIRTVIAGDAGSIASALITGKRDAISAPVNDAMYVSSLAHVLSISGYHMAVVAGVVFFVVRAALAFSVTLANRFPIKKWAAVVALFAATFYLVLSGAEVATQRSFIMTAIVLGGVLIDRPVLTLRTLAVAALAVMAITPEAVAHPSFQMSFAATLALIATYERGLPWIASGADTSLGARVALWGVREVATLVVASLVAGFATTPYAAFHFHRAAPYGVLANLLAMPIVSAWVMPSGLLSLVVLPFGFDAPLWRLMGGGIDWMVTVALGVANLPGAVGRIPAFEIEALLVATFGLILICLLRSPLRWSGAVALIVAAVMAARSPAPAVLIAASGDSFAVRGPEGRLHVLKTGSDSFAVREWLAADADARLPTDPSLREGFACDNTGCIIRRADGQVVAIATAAEAFADDCRRATLVLTPRQGPPECGATLIDRKAWREGGALALRRLNDRWEVTAARPNGHDRPWAPAATAGNEVRAANRTVEKETPHQQADWNDGD